MARRCAPYLIFFGLSWVVARACLAGVVRRSGTFLRTPKVRGARAWQRALRASSPEASIAAGCVVVALGLALRNPGATGVGLVGFLMLQAMVYGAAPLCGVWAEGIRLTPPLRTFSRSAQSTGERPPVVRGAALRVGLAAALSVAAGLAASLAVAAPAGVAPFSSGAVPGGGPARGQVVPGAPGSPPAASASAPATGVGGQGSTVTRGPLKTSTGGPQPAAIGTSSGTAGAAAAAAAQSSATAASTASSQPTAQGSPPVSPGATPTARPTTQPTAHPTPSASRPSATPTAHP